jgi:alkylation response protein AidB-like acyl-CoA dehydrogenase
VDLRLTAAEVAFRDELVEWLHSALPGLPPRPPERDYWARREFDTHWQQQLFHAGYAGINWPKEYGGRGATPTEHLIYLEESQRLGAPKLETHFVGNEHAGPTLIMEATPDQKRAHLPRILEGTEVWCQGFSEPNAGSDLASLSTRAVRDGDHYVVSGQKIWTSFAHIADYCELLVRTDTNVPKHRGITWLICPMDLPGIEARPIRTVVDSSEFCETFFDEVRVPVANRVGDENDGWRVAMVTFSFERGTGFLTELLSAQRELHELVGVTKHVTRRGARAFDDAEIRRELGRLQADFDALWALTKRNVSQAARTGMVGPGGSVFKLHYADVSKRMGELAFRVLERMALAPDETAALTDVELAARRIRAFTVSIAAGTSQIQRNIIGERILGLPRER